MKKLKTLFLVTFLLSLCALCFASCRTTKNPPSLPQISAPTNLRREENFLVWNSVEGATGYVVSVEGVEHESSETRFDLSTITDPADYIIRVKACGDGFADSDWVTRNYHYEVGTFTYRLIDDGSAYEVSGVLTLKDGAAKIPSKYNGKPVTPVGAEAFKDNRELTSVELPNSITLIKDGAFWGCTALTGIRLPQALTTLGEHSFQNTALISVTIPEGVTELPHMVFQQCASLESVKLPNGLKVIGEQAFFACTNLATVVFPEGLEEIGKSSFFNCTKFDGALPQSLKALGASSFCNTALKSVTVPNGITKIERAVFSGCKDLSEVTILGNVTSIGERAFNRCTALKGLSIADSVTAIGESAFSECTAMESIALPDGVTAIGMSAFEKCSALQTIKLPKNLKKISGSMLRGTGLTSLTLPEGVTKIGSYAFADCTKLTSLTLPNRVELIGQKAFEGSPWYDAQPNGAVYFGRVFYAYKGTIAENTEITVRAGTLSVSPFACYDSSINDKTMFRNITKVVLPADLKIIGDCAFYFAPLSEILFPQSLEHIGNFAFTHSDFTKIDLPESLNYIGYQAFSDSPKTVHFENTADWLLAYESIGYSPMSTPRQEFGVHTSLPANANPVPETIVADDEKASQYFIPIEQAFAYFYPIWFKK